MVTLVALAVVFSTLYVLYASTAYSHLWRLVHYRAANGQLRMVGLRATDWPFMPMLASHFLTLELFDQPHPAPHFRAVGWFGSLPVSMLYAVGIRALYRKLRKVGAEN